MLELKTNMNFSSRAPQISAALHLSPFIPVLTAAPQEKNY